jgi:hypothetical protein
MGQFNGSVDFGGGVLTASSGSDMFLAKLTGTGAHLWSKRFGALTGTGDPFSVSADGDDNVIVAGRFSGSFDLGGGALTSAGGSDLFVAKYSPAGAHLWSKRYGDAAQQTVAYARPDASGDIFVGAGVVGTIDFGNGALSSAGAQDIFVARLTAAGSAVWARRFGDANVQLLNDLVIEPSGGVVFTGSIAGTTDFGGGSLTSAGGSDAVVVRLRRSDGAHELSTIAGDAASQAGSAIAASGGAIYVTGSFTGTINLTGTLLTAVSTLDLFIAKLLP